jgi:predicted RND superfamily exporter protein
MKHVSIINVCKTKLKDLLKVSLAQNGKLLCIFTLIFLFAWVVFSLSQVRHLSTTYSMKQFLPKNDPLLSREENVKKMFDLDQTPGFLVALSLPVSEKRNWLSKEYTNKMDTVVQRVTQIKNVKHVLALSNTEGLGESSGALEVAPILKTTSINKLKARILSDPLLTPLLISRDARTVMLVVDTGFTSIEKMTAVESELKKQATQLLPQVKVRIGGVLAVQTDIGNLLLKELKNVVTFAFIVSIVVLSLIFSNFAGILIPLFIIGCANIVILGGMSYFKIPFTVLSTTIPILVNISVLAIATHTMLRLDEERAELLYKNKFSVVVSILKTLAVPNFLAALTSSVGFMTLTFVNTPIISEYGISTSVSMLATWLFTNLMMLGLLPLTPIPKARNWTRSKARWSLFVMKYKVPVVLSVLTLTVVSSFGGKNLNWSIRLFGDLPSNHPTREATEYVDSHLGGVLPLELVLESKLSTIWNNPENILKISRLLSQIRALPAVGNAVGLPDLFSARGSKKFLNPLGSKKSLAETYFIYSLTSKNPVHLFLTGDGKATHISIRMHDVKAFEMTAATNKILNLAKQEFPALRIYSTGMAISAHTLDARLARELIFGFWKAMFIICLLLAVVFRSFKWALVACAPNLVPPALLLGALGITQIPIKPGIGLVFTIALGLSFNNTVYLLERLRRQGSGMNMKASIRKAFYLESNPCVVSTLVIFAGFTVFLGSYFPLNKYFGAFMLLSIVGGLLGDLVLLPALLMFFPEILSQKTALDEKSMIDSDDLIAAIEKSQLPKADIKESGGSRELPLVASIAFIFILFGFNSFGADFVQSKDAKSILKRVESQIASKDEEATVKIKITESDGSSKERKLHIKRKSGAKNFVLARLEDPADLRGTAFLSVNSKDSENQWLYLPSSKQTRKIAGGNKQSGFLGSEISFEDLSASTVVGSKASLMPDELLLGKKYFVIDTRTKKGQSSYARVRSWISQSDYLLLKAEYFDLSNHLVKVISFNKYKLFAGKVWRAQNVNVVNKQNRRKTDLTLIGLNINKNIPDSAFAVSSLDID